MAESRASMGKYELLEELGRGGFATVYRARDPSLDRAIALKVLHAGYASRSDVVPRFLDEARRAVAFTVRLAPQGRGRNCVRLHREC